MIGSTVRSSTTTDKPKKPFDMARALLTVAAVRNDHLIAALKLPVAAARQVVRSLLNAGFAEEVPVPINHPGYAWRTGEDGGVLALRCQSAFNSFQVTASKSFHLVSPISAVSCAV
jgi:hypothetical protein